MKKRYNPKTPGRFPEDFKERCEKLKKRDYALSVNISGPFWQLREWCGFENLCILMIEKPAFVQEMVDFWMEFVSKVIKPILEKVQLDRVWISEDMACKGYSMISPEMIL